MVVVPVSRVSLATSDYAVAIVPDQQAAVGAMQAEPARQREVPCIIVLLLPIMMVAVAAAVVVVQMHLEGLLCLRLLPVLAALRVPAGPAVAAAAADASGAAADLRVLLLLLLRHLCRAPRHGVGLQAGLRRRAASTGRRHVNHMTALPGCKQTGTVGHSRKAGHMCANEDFTERKIMLS